MGTLFNQPARNGRYITKSEVEALLTDAIDMSKKLKIDLADVLQAYRIKELERKNNLYVTNGDISDEQLAGFGELVEKLTLAIEGLNSD